MVESATIQNEVREIWVRIIYLNKIHMHLSLLMKTNSFLTKINAVKCSCQKQKLETIV